MLCCLLRFMLCCLLRFMLCCLLRSQTPLGTESLFGTPRLLLFCHSLERSLAAPGTERLFGTPRRSVPGAVSDRPPDKGGGTSRAIFDANKL